MSNKTTVIYCFKIFKPHYLKKLFVKKLILVTFYTPNHLKLYTYFMLCSFGLFVIKNDQESFIYFQLVSYIISKIKNPLLFKIKQVKTQIKQHYKYKNTVVKLDFLGFSPLSYKKVFSLLS